MRLGSAAAWAVIAADVGLARAQTLNTPQFYPWIHECFDLGASTCTGGATVCVGGGVHEPRWWHRRPARAG